MNLFKQYTVRINDTRYIIHYTRETCLRGTINSSYYCADITAHPNLIRNSTEMIGDQAKVGFMIPSVICPNKKMGTGPDGSHATFKIAFVYENDYRDTRYRYITTVNHRFTDLTYFMLDKIEFNPAYNSDKTPPSGELEYGTNFLVGCESRFSFVFDIWNRTHKSSWEKLKVKFTDNLRTISLNTQSCQMEVRDGIFRSLRMKDPAKVSINCSYSNG